VRSTQGRNSELVCGNPLTKSGTAALNAWLMGEIAMKPASAEYWVYENYPHNKAVGHVRSCSYFKMHGGQTLKTGKWHGPFDSKQSAQSWGTATGRPFHWCPRC